MGNYQAESRQPMGWTGVAPRVLARRTGGQRAVLGDPKGEWVSDIIAKSQQFIDNS